MTNQQIAWLLTTGTALLVAIVNRWLLDGGFTGWWARRKEARRAKQLLRSLQRLDENQREEELEERHIQAMREAREEDETRERKLLAKAIVDEMEQRGSAYRGNP